MRWMFEWGLTPFSSVGEELGGGSQQPAGRGGLGFADLFLGPTEVHPVVAERRAEGDDTERSIRS